jgi:hypothetical protein
MSKVIIKLAPNTIRAELHFAENKARIAKAMLPFYTQHTPILLNKAGMDAAEEAFDLTNNPSREADRNEFYGPFRSLSVGDIVEVDGVDYLCDSFGWLTI